MTDYSDSIRTFIEQEMISQKSGIAVSESESLIEKGIVDSLGVQILISYLEREFDIKIIDNEIVPENFETVELISRFVNYKLSSMSDQE